VNVYVTKEQVLSITAGIAPAHIVKVIEVNIEVTSHCLISPSIADLDMIDATVFNILSLALFCLTCKSV
jgi:hypothetical protein